MARLQAIRERVLAAVPRQPVERLPLFVASGRWLNEPVLARVSAPPFACSAMDGFALRAEDLEGTTAPRVTATIYAGDPPPRELAPGECARIYTGAPVPANAAAVVAEEAAVERGDTARPKAAVAAGANIRRAGEDVPAGAEALPAGARLGPRQLGLCLAVGAEEVAVARPPRVALISTGDEVVGGRTPDSNGAVLAAALAELGAQVDARQVGDVLPALEAALREAIATADAVLTIGGVSVGAKDLVPAALEPLGAEVLVHGVPMKPGKPVLFALAGGKPVFGLPGSPSACLVAFEVFARPALLQMCGAARPQRRVVRVPLAAPVWGRGGRERFVWARIEPGGHIRPMGRDAAQIRGPALADALMRIPEDAGDLETGEEVEAWLLDDAAP